MKKKVFVLLVALMMIIVTVAGCGGGNTGGASDSGAGSSASASGDLKPIKMGLSMSALDFVIFQAFSDYLEQNLVEMGKDRGWAVDYQVVSANSDVTKQANDIRDMLAAGCEVIFCQAVDSKTILSSVQEVHDAGKIFIMYNRKADASASGNQIPKATYNMDSFYQAYEGMVQLFEIMKADGVEPVDIIDVHGDTGDENAHNREAGFRKAVEEYGFADRVVQVVDVGVWEVDLALQNTAAALQAYPNSNCMYVASDGMLPGVQTALENAGKWVKRGEAGHVYMCSTDMYPIGIQATLDRFVDANVECPAWQSGYEAAIGAFDLLEGLPVSQDETKIRGLVITSDNAAEVLAAGRPWGVEYADRS